MMASTMTRVGAVPKLRVGTRTFVLIPEREYERLLHGAETEATDAIEFARASIGRDLRRKRERTHLTQAQVAARAGIRLETLSRLENGHGNPTVATIRRILRALGERA